MRALIGDALDRRGFAVTRAGSAAEALAVLDTADPDLLVTDIELGERPNGLELAMIVRRRAPQVAVLFVSNLSRDAAMARARDAVSGASFVNKSAITTTDELIEAAEAVLADRPVAFDVDDDGRRAAVLRLTEGQLQTTALLAAGYSNAEIARRRGVSVRAVEKSVERVFAALGLSGDDRTTPRVAAATMYTSTFGDPGSGVL